MPNIKKTMMAAAGAGAAGATGAAGSLWIWGKGTFGTLGNNQILNVSSPVQVGSLTDWKNVAIARYTVHAVKSDGSLWTWGQNNEGACGTGVSGIKYSSPVQVGSLTNWATPGGGRTDTTHAIKTDGTLWAWGGSGAGRAGLNGSVTYSLSSPVQVGSLTNWKKITSGYASIALKTDGTIWVWGKAALGACGISDGISGEPLSAQRISSPIQLGSLTTWADIGASYKGGAAVKTDGTLWVWGHAGYGELGNNQVTVDASSPIQLGSLTTWKAVWGMSQGFIAAKNDGTLWSWGRSLEGTHGDNNNISRSSPVQVGSTDWDYNYVFRDAGGFHGVHLQTDGSLWTWGRANNGQLGRGDVVNYSSPVQLGSLKTWQSAGADGINSWGIKS